MIIGKVQLTKPFNIKISLSMFSPKHLISLYLSINIKT